MGRHRGTEVSGPERGAGPCSREMTWSYSDLAFGARVGRTHACTHRQIKAKLVWQPALRNTIRDRSPSYGVPSHTESMHNQDIAVTATI